MITDSFAIKYTTVSAYPDESSDDPQASSSNRGTIPGQTFMSALYPNPFKETMVIGYKIGDLARTEDISLRFYDITGRLVKQYNYPTIQPNCLQRSR